MNEKIVPPARRFFFGFDSTRLLNLVLDRIGGDWLLDAVILRPQHKPGMVARLKFDESRFPPSTGPVYNVLSQRVKAGSQGP